MQSILPPQLEPIVYPESDGEPIAESTLQFRWIVLVKDNLDGMFANENVFVAGDLFWYPVEGEPTIRQAPDILVAFGRPRGHRRSYLQWREGGIAPQVVWEILSHSNRPAEMLRKSQFYEQYGVEEYYIYDPDTSNTIGWINVGGRFEPIPNMNGWVSPRMKIRFEIVDGELRLFRPDGKPFLTFLELLDEQAKAKQQRDEATRQRDDAQKQRDDAQRQADQASRELDVQARLIEELKQKLRDQGIDPDQPKPSQ